MSLSSYVAEMGFSCSRQWQQPLPSNGISHQCLLLTHLLITTLRRTFKEENITRCNVIMLSFQNLLGAFISCAPALQVIFMNTVPIFLLEYSLWDYQNNPQGILCFEIVGLICNMFSFFRSVVLYQATLFSYCRDKITYYFTLYTSSDTRTCFILVFVDRL